MENKQDIMEGLIETHRQVKKQAWNKIKQSLPPSVDLIEQKLGLEISERNKSNYPLQIVKWLDELDELDKQLITNILKKNPSLITISEFLEWCERLLPDATLEDIDPELTKLIQQNFQHYSQFFYILAWARRYCNGNEVIDFELINFTFEELTSGLTITELTLLTQAICYDYYLVQEEIEEAREDNDALALSRDANYLLDIKNFTFEWVRKAKKELGIIGGSDRPSV